jgi:hypothetical protein
LIGRFCIILMAVLFVVPAPAFAQARSSVAATAANNCSHAAALSHRSSSSRSLSSAKTTQLHRLCAQVHVSASKLQFWNSPSNRWTLYLNQRHKKCWQVHLAGPEALCLQARAAVRTHTQKLVRINSKIELLSSPWWCRNLSGNRALGCQMAYVIWPSETEWNALDYLWTIESGWVETKHNPSSEACGIPQGLNNCSYGYDPRAQIAWGLVYILKRPDYGSPSVALALWKSRSPHWY